MSLADKRDFAFFCPPSGVSQRLLNIGLVQKWILKQ